MASPVLSDKVENLESNLKKCCFEDLIIFCGAGISYNSPTNLPTVFHFVKSVIDESVNESVKKTEILAKISRIVTQPRFEVLVDDIIKYHDAALEIANIFYSKNFNKIHYGIGKLLTKGASVITTNFDCCIENSINVEDIELHIFKGNDLDISVKPNKSSLIKPHGSHSKIRFSNQVIISISALAKLNNGFTSLPNWKNYLIQSMENKTIIFLGYSGSDDFDLTPIILESNYKNIIWLKYNDSVSSIIESSEKLNDNHLMGKLKRASFYEGRPIDLIQLLFHEELIDFKSDESISDNPVLDYLNLCYPYEIQKQELLSTILFHYNLYDEVLDISSKEFSKPIFLNQIRSLFRQGKHNEICEKLKEINYLSFPYKFASRIIHHHSTSLFYIGEFTRAEDLGKTYARLAEENKDFDSQIHSFIQLGAFAFNRANYNQSRDYYLKALSIHENDSPNIEGAANCYWGLAAISHMDGNYEEAKDYNLKALDQHLKLGNFFSVAYIKHNLGLIYLVTSDYDNAKDYLISSETLFNDIIANKPDGSGQQGLIYSQLTLSKLYFKLNDFEMFQAKILKAFNTLKSCIGHPNFYEIILSYLYGIAKYNGHAALQKEISGIKESEFYKVIFERNYETLALGEIKAKELLSTYMSESDITEFSNLLKSFERLSHEIFIT